MNNWTVISKRFYCEVCGAVSLDEVEEPIKKFLVHCEIAMTYAKVETKLKVLEIILRHSDTLSKNETPT